MSDEISIGEGFNLLLRSKNKKIIASVTKLLKDLNDKEIINAMAKQIWYGNKINLLIFDQIGIYPTKKSAYKNLFSQILNSPSLLRLRSKELKKLYDTILTSYIHRKKFIDSDIANKLLNLPYILRDILKKINNNKKFENIIKQCVEKYPNFKVANFPKKIEFKIKYLLFKHLLLLYSTRANSRSIIFKTLNELFALFNSAERKKLAELLPIIKIEFEFKSYFSPTSPMINFLLRNNKLNLVLPSHRENDAILTFIEQPNLRLLIIMLKNYDNARIVEIIDFILSHLDKKRYSKIYRFLAHAKDNPELIKKITYAY